jgi:hypothetical protein
MTEKPLLPYTAGSPGAAASIPGLARLQRLVNTSKILDHQNYESARIIEITNFRWLLGLAEEALIARARAERQRVDGVTW